MARVAQHARAVAPDGARLAGAALVGRGLDVARDTDTLVRRGRPFGRFGVRVAFDTFAAGGVPVLPTRPRHALRAAFKTVRARLAPAVGRQELVWSAR